MRRAAKTDDNQKRIVAALRRSGATVLHLHTIGQGCPDLLIGWQGKNILAELKDGDKIQSKQKLTPDEIQWHERWRGQVAVITSVDDALKLINT